jgi:hypothetical protein
MLTLTGGSVTFTVAVLNAFPSAVVAVTVHVFAVAGAV